MLPQNASLEIFLFPLFSSWVWWRNDTQFQMDQSVELLTHTHSLIFSPPRYSAEFCRHTYLFSAAAAWISTHSSPHTHVCVLRLSSGCVSPCLAVSQTPRSNQETTPVIQLTLSAPRVSKGGAAIPATSRQHGTQTPRSILICLSLLVSFPGC